MARRREPSLERYLLDGERVVVAVRQHWGKLSGPVALAVVGFAFVLWVDAHTRPWQGALSRLLWLLWLGVLVWTLYQVLEWRYDRFVATDKRLLLTYGLLTRRVAMMPLIKVTDMSYRRSIPGRVFGYGQFVLESAGQDQALRQIDWVPSPDHTYRVICAEMFGVDDHDRVLVERMDGDDQDRGGPGRNHSSGTNGNGTNGSGNNSRGPVQEVRPVANPLGRGDGPRSAVQQGWSYSEGIPLHEQNQSPEPSGEVIYSSDEARLRRRMADTGPIPLPPEADD